MIRVVGPDADAVAAALRDRGGDAAAGTAAEVGDADAAVALGESAAAAVVRHRVDVPVLAVDCGDGVPSVPRADRDAALDALVGGEVRETTRRTLLVDVDGRGVRALFDALLVTVEPASISEYAIDAAGDAADLTRIADTRADGVAVATAAGSHGYANAAGGPLLGPGVEGVAVVPVAPFSVGAADWVASLPVEMTVVREEADVALLVDGRDVGRVPPGDPVRIEAGPEVTFLRVPGVTGRATSPVEKT